MPICPKCGHAWPYPSQDQRVHWKTGYDKAGEPTVQCGQHLKSTVAASEPEWVFIPEFGIGSDNRRADAFAMGLWPSRGLQLHGFEVKVNRAGTEAMRRAAVELQRAALSLERQADRVEQLSW